MPELACGPQGDEPPPGSPARKKSRVGSSYCKKTERLFLKPRARTLQVGTRHIELAWAHNALDKNECPFWFHCPVFSSDETWNEILGKEAAKTFRGRIKNVTEGSRDRITFEWSADSGTSSIRVPFLNRNWWLKNVSGYLGSERPLAREFAEKFTMLLLKLTMTEVSGHDEEHEQEQGQKSRTQGRPPPPSRMGQRSQEQEQDFGRRQEQHEDYETCSEGSDDDLSCDADDEEMYCCDRFIQTGKCLCKHNEGISNRIMNVVKSREDALREFDSQPEGAPNMLERLLDSSEKVFIVDFHALNNLSDKVEKKSTNATSDRAAARNLLKGRTKVKIGSKRSGLGSDKTGVWTFTGMFGTRSEIEELRGPAEANKKTLIKKMFAAGVFKEAAYVVASSIEHFKGRRLMQADAAVQVDICAPTNRKGSKRKSKRKLPPYVKTVETGIVSRGSCPRCRKKSARYGGVIHALPGAAIGCSHEVKPERNERKPLKEFHERKDVVEFKKMQNDLLSVAVEVGTSLDLALKNLEGNRQMGSIEEAAAFAAEVETADGSDTSPIQLVNAEKEAFVKSVISNVDASLATAEYLGENNYGSIVACGDGIPLCSDSSLAEDEAIADMAKALDALKLYPGVDTDGRVKKMLEDRVKSFRDLKATHIKASADKLFSIQCLDEYVSDVEVMFPDRAMDEVVEGHKDYLQERSKKLKEDIAEVQQMQEYLAKVLKSDPQDPLAPPPLGDAVTEKLENLNMHVETCLLHSSKLIMEEAAYENSERKARLIGLYEVHRDAGALIRRAASLIDHEQTPDEQLLKSAESIHKEFNAVKKKRSKLHGARVHPELFIYSALDYRIDAVKEDIENLFTDVRSRYHKKKGIDQSRLNIRRLKRIYSEISSEKTRESGSSTTVLQAKIESARQSALRRIRFGLLEKSGRATEDLSNHMIMWKDAVKAYMDFCNSGQANNLKRDLISAKVESYSIWATRTARWKSTRCDLPFATFVEVTKFDPSTDLCGGPQEPNRMSAWQAGNLVASANLSREGYEVLREGDDLLAEYLPKWSDDFCTTNAAVYEELWESLAAVADPLNKQTLFALGKMVRAKMALWLNSGQANPKELDTACLRLTLGQDGVMVSSQISMLNIGGSIQGLDHVDPLEVRDALLMGAQYGKESNDNISHYFTGCMQAFPYDPDDMQTVCPDIHVNIAGRQLKIRIVIGWDKHFARIAMKVGSSGCMQCFSKSREYSCECTHVLPFVKPNNVYPMPVWKEGFSESEQMKYDEDLKKHCDEHRRMEKAFEEAKVFKNGIDSDTMRAGWVAAKKAILSEKKELWVHDPTWEDAVLEREVVTYNAAGDRTAVASKAVYLHKLVRADGVRNNVPVFSEASACYLPYRVNEINVDAVNFARGEDDNNEETVKRLKEELAPPLPLRVLVEDGDQGWLERTSDSEVFGNYPIGCDTRCLRCGGESETTTETSNDENYTEAVVILSGLKVPVCRHCVCALHMCLNNTAMVIRVCVTMSMNADEHLYKSGTGMKSYQKRVTDRIARTGAKVTYSRRMKKRKVTPDDVDTSVDNADDENPHEPVALRVKNCHGNEMGKLLDKHGLRDCAAILREAFEAVDKCSDGDSSKKGRAVTELVMLHTQIKHELYSLDPWGMHRLGVIKGRDLYGTGPNIDCVHKPPVERHEDNEHRRGCAAGCKCEEWKGYKVPHVPNFTSKNPERLQHLWNTVRCYVKALSFQKKVARIMAILRFLCPKAMSGSADDHFDFFGSYVHDLGKHMVDIIWMYGDAASLSQLVLETLNKDLIKANRHRAPAAAAYKRDDREDEARKAPTSCAVFAYTRSQLYKKSLDAILETPTPTRIGKRLLSSTACMPTTDGVQKCVKRPARIVRGRVMPSSHIMTYSHPVTRNSELSSKFTASAEHPEGETPRGFSSTLRIDVPPLPMHADFLGSSRSMLTRAGSGRYSPLNGHMVSNDSALYLECAELNRPVHKRLRLDRGDLDEAEHVNGLQTLDQKRQYFGDTHPLTYAHEMRNKLFFALEAYHKNKEGASNPLSLSNSQKGLVSNFKHPNLPNVMKVVNQVSRQLLGNIGHVAERVNSQDMQKEKTRRRNEEQPKVPDSWKNPDSEDSKDLQLMSRCIQKALDPSDEDKDRTPQVIFSKHYKANRGKAVAKFVTQFNEYVGDFFKTKNSNGKATGKKAWCIERKHKESSYSDLELAQTLVSTYTNGEKVNQTVPATAHAAGSEDTVTYFSNGSPTWSYRDVNSAPITRLREMLRDVSPEVEAKLANESAELLRYLLVCVGTTYATKDKSFNQKVWMLSESEDDAACLWKKGILNKDNLPDPNDLPEFLEKKFIQDHGVARYDPRLCRLIQGNPLLGTLKNILSPHSACSKCGRNYGRTREDQCDKSELGCLPLRAKLYFDKIDLLADESQPAPIPFTEAPVQAGPGCA